MLGKKLALLLLVVAACVPLAQAWLWTDALGGTPTAVSCQAVPDSLSWVGVSLAAIIVAVVIDAGLWALQGVLSNPKYADFLRAHLYMALEAAVILGILAVSLAGLQQFGEGNIDTARAYSLVIRNTAMMDFAMVLSVSTVTSFFTNVVPQFKPFSSQLGLSLSFQVAPMFRPIYDTLGLLIQLITTSIVQWTAHEFLLCFVKNSMLTILVPVGIFLRTFGLKGGGNALIGIALALYFVYPFMLMQIGETVTKHMETQLPETGQTTAWGPLPQCTNRPICCIGPQIYPADFTQPYLKNGPNWDAELTDRVSVAAVNNGTIYIGWDGGSYNGGTGASCMYNTLLGPVYDGVMGALRNAPLYSVAIGAGATFVTFLLAKLMNVQFLSIIMATPVIAFAKIAIVQTVYFLFVVSIVMPIFVIFITITFAKEVAKALGTEIDLSTLEKII